MSPLTRISLLWSKGPFLLLAAVVEEAGKVQIGLGEAGKAGKAVKAGFGPRQAVEHVLEA